MGIVALIIEERLDEARDLMHEALALAQEHVKLDKKRRLAAEDWAGGEETLEEGRFKIVRARIRKGKIQRRKKVSTVKGFTFRKKGKAAPKLIRMSVAERRRRRIGQKRGKLKRRAKMFRIKINLAKSMRKRRSLGLR